jgi:DNA-binding transcriptional LysR family regulator
MAVAKQPPYRVLANMQVTEPQACSHRSERVHLEWAPTPVTGFFLYYPSRRQMRPALKALVDFLRKERRRAS